MLIIPLVLGPLESNCYVVAAREAGPGAVIDPADDAPAIVDAAGKSRIRIAQILLTHGHFDHILGLAEFRRLTGAPVSAHPLEAPLLASASGCGAELFGLSYEPVEVDQTLTDGQTVRIGDLEIEVLHTPGHTPGSLSFYVKDAWNQDPAVFCGDALFSGSIGRTDLPGGSPGALMRSIREKLLALPEATRVFPGHGPQTSIGREARHNPFLARGTEKKGLDSGAPDVDISGLGG